MLSGLFLRVAGEAGRVGGQHEIETVAKAAGRISSPVQEALNELAGRSITAAPE